MLLQRAHSRATTVWMRSWLTREQPDPAGETWRGTADGENGRKKKC